MNGQYCGRIVGQQHAKRPEERLQNRKQDGQADQALYLRPLPVANECADRKHREQQHHHGHDGAVQELNQRVQPPHRRDDVAVAQRPVVPTAQRRAGVRVDEAHSVDPEEPYGDHNAQPKGQARESPRLRHTPLPFHGRARQSIPRTPRTMARNQTGK
ncbi:hypothetical protein GCM10025857_25250 [Alicyclobacillus contaminans]|nr:hypothetical protein GCM10025857_25250 [Alicyclobacillus contaminans]